MAQADISRLEFYPLTVERWADFEKLFGNVEHVEAAGVCGGDCNALNLNGRKAKETDKPLKE